MDRHHKIGIKHVIRLEWMNRTVDMLLAGMTAKEIRNELARYLADKKQSGGIGQRGKKTYSMAIGILMQCWCNPDPELVPLRNDALQLAKNANTERLPLHWAMISAAYPFWSAVAQQTGRLLDLQGYVTQQQIVKRLKETYGDRQTVSRYARYVIRSFVAWGILQDSQIKGRYVTGNRTEISDKQMALPLLEGELLASSDSSNLLGIQLSAPSFFSFILPPLSGNYITRNSTRLITERFGLDHEVVRLMNP